MAPSISPPELNPREERIALHLVQAIGIMSHLLDAVENGTSTSARDRVDQLVQCCGALSIALSRHDYSASAPAIAAHVAERSQAYRIGKALYGQPAQAEPEPSPLEQMEAAKRERDFFGEVAAAQAGQQRLESAPWYPARPGDVVHVHYAEISGVLAAHGETYIVEADGAGPDGWMGLRLLSSTRDPELPGGGDFELDGTPDPLLTMWFEAGPASLTIVRDGLVVHGGGSRG